MKKLFESKEMKEITARKLRSEWRVERYTRAAERQAEAICSIANSLRGLTAVFDGAARELQRVAKPKAPQRRAMRADKKRTIRRRR